MKFIHRLSLFIIVALVAMPLVIMAQDGGQPQPQPDDDLIVPIPPQPQPDDDLIVPIPPQPQPDDDLIVPIQPQPQPDDDLIVPIPGPDDDLVVPLPEPDTCGNDDPNTVFIPLCPPTVTPKPPKTAVPTTKIINGMWVLDPNGSTYTSNGQCQIDGGDNGGGVNIGTDLEDLPRVPVCMTSDNQWLTVDSGSAYPLVLANYYSQQEMSRELVTTNGKTSGSMNINTTRQYHVISPTEIEFSYIRHEQGGCTTNSSVRYVLIEANELVCKGVVMTPNYTAVPTQMPTAQPGETQQPPITPEPPIQVGPYVITLPPVDATCPADKMPPSSAINLIYDNNQNMFINFGGGSYTLYWNGSDYYEFQDGNQFSVSVNTYEGGASLAWSKEGCFISSPITQQGAPVATSVPVEPTDTAITDVAAMAGSSFGVTVDTPEYLCAAENKSLLPDLSSAVLTAQADGNFTFAVGGTDYTLTNADGIHGFNKINDNGSMLVITMNGFYEGKGAGNFMVVSADGKSCVAQLTFSPKG